MWRFRLTALHPQRVSPLTVLVQALAAAGCMLAAGSRLRPGMSRTDGAATIAPTEGDLEAVCVGTDAMVRLGLDSLQREYVEWRRAEHGSQVGEPTSGDPMDDPLRVTGQVARGGQNPRAGVVRSGRKAKAEDKRPWWTNATPARRIFFLFRCGGDSPSMCNEGDTLQGSRPHGRSSGCRKRNQVRSIDPND
jgi:hypothetical protein